MPAYKPNGLPENDVPAVNAPGAVNWIALATVEVSTCAWFVKTSEPEIVAVDEEPSDIVIGTVPEPASVTVLPACRSSAGFVVPEIVSVTPADDDRVALTLLMKRRRPIVCCGTAVTMQVGVVEPLKTRMSLDEVVERVGVQFEDVVQLALEVLFHV